MALTSKTDEAKLVTQDHTQLKRARDRSQLAHSAGRDPEFAAERGREVTVAQPRPRSSPCSLGGGLGGRRPCPGPIVALVGNGECRIANIE